MDNLEALEQQRKENFEKIGQYMLQKKYYEDEIKELLIYQENLCKKIFELKRSINAE